MAGSLVADSVAGAAWTGAASETGATGRPVAGTTAGLDFSDFAGFFFVLFLGLGLAGATVFLAAAGFTAADFFAAGEDLAAVFLPTFLAGLVAFFLAAGFASVFLAAGFAADFLAAFGLAFLAGAFFAVFLPVAFLLAAFLLKALAAAGAVWGDAAAGFLLAVFLAGDFFFELAAADCFLAMKSTLLEFAKEVG